MGTDKRDRQKAMQQAKRDEVARLAAREAWRQRILLFVVLTVLVVGAFAILRRAADDPAENAFDPSDLGTTSTTTSTPETTETANSSETTQPSPVELQPPPPGASIEGPTPCPEVDGSSQRTTEFSEAPPMCIDADKSYTAVISTDLGDVTIELDAASAPSTVNNFVVLARYGYYEGVPFHRIIPGFVAQVGDAVGPTLGIGGPGYKFDDELPEPEGYVIGSLAMANTGPDTNGSQFFIITGDAGVALPSQYSLFGTVMGGMDVVEQIDDLGSEGGSPTEAVTITQIIITES